MTPRRQRCEFSRPLATGVAPVEPPAPVWLVQNCKRILSSSPVLLVPLSVVHNLYGMTGRDRSGLRNVNKSKGRNAAVSKHVQAYQRRKEEACRRLRRWTL